MKRRALGAGAGFVIWAALAHADPPPNPVFIDPYDLPDAPRPPTLPELTHPGIELTVESTFGVLRPNIDSAGQRPSDTGAYVQRFSLEWPIALRRFFVGATYEIAAAVPPAGGGFEFIGGNLDVNARTVWATSAGLAFGGGLGITIPIPDFAVGSDAAGVAQAAATIRPWDQALFQPGYLTFRPFFDVRDIDGPLVLQFREGLEFQLDTENWPGFHSLAITAAYIGYRVARPIGVGIEAFELYFLDKSVADDQRAVFAVSPSIRLMTPYVQPALSFVTNVGTPLFGSVETWWALRLGATVVWDPVKQSLEQGQGKPAAGVAAPP
jgi:hypothetical protein